jgi:hypothetical protein
MPEKDARGTVIVDFAVINLSAVPPNQPKQKIRYGGGRLPQQMLTFSWKSKGSSAGV